MNPLLIAAHPLRQIDWLLLLLIAGLAAVGLAALGSAIDSQATIERQHLYLGFGAALMVACACWPWRWWRNLALPLYLATLLLLLAVPQFGFEVNNSRRWLAIGSLSLQPSEIAKITVPLVIAWLYCLTKRRHLWQHLIAVPLIIAPVALVLDQPDLGTASMIAASGLAVVFLAGLSWWLIGGALAGFAVALPVVWEGLLKDYQRSRILSVIDPYQDPLGAGYHTIQSSIAVGSGGIWGKGLGQGSQSQLGFLPEKHTDFIFAVYAEELGFAGCVGLLLLIMLVFLRMLVIASAARDSCGGMLVGALALAFAAQALINLGMVSGVLPVVGLPLPLVSYGGTSLLTFMAAFGIAMAVARHRPPRLQ